MDNREKVLAFFEVMRGIEETPGVSVNDWCPDQVELKFDGCRVWLDDDEAADELVTALGG